MIWNTFNNIQITIPTRWHKQLGGALADAILDRVAANSYQIHIKGNQSMRTKRSKKSLSIKVGIVYRHFINMMRAKRYNVHFTLNIELLHKECDSY